MKTGAEPELGKQGSPRARILLVGGLLGLVLVVVLGRPSSVEDDRRIVISEGDLQQIRASWVRLWQREPTAEEMQSQVQQFVRDEVMYREGVRRGYAEDDPVVRHAMKMKMEFLGEAQAEEAEPTADEIVAYFTLRAERYRTPTKVSFVHVYLSRDRRGAQAGDDARATLEALIADDPALDGLSGYGDRFMLQSHYVAQSEADLLKNFGPEFATHVVGLEPERWVGPVESAYGLHLVYVYDRQQSGLPELRTVEESVVEDMRYENSQAAKDLFYTEILRGYQIELGTGFTDLLGDS